MSPTSTSVVVGRASRKMMHEGAVRVMAEGMVVAPAGKTQRRKAEGGTQKPQSVTKGTVETRTDFTGEPPVE